MSCALGSEIISETGNEVAMMVIGYLEDFNEDRGRRSAQRVTRGGADLLVVGGSRGHENCWGTPVASVRHMVKCNK